MSTYQPIFQALLTQVGSAATAVALPLWLDNTKYTPDTTQPYIQSKMALVDPYQDSLGVDGTNMQHGFITLLVCYPLGGGYGAALTTADTVASYFKRGSKFTTPTFEITISKCGVLTPIPDENWYKVPVRAFFYAQTPN